MIANGTKNDGGGHIYGEKKTMGKYLSGNLCTF
jgi:hypothetical protein